MDALPVDYDPFGMVPVEHNPFIGDPEAAGAAAASSAMEPAVAAHFAGIGQDLASRVGTGDDGFPLERAMSVALGVGPGAIRAYHGSPYDFDAFDPAKIGTGEGAQAYGHGLYFAENPNVAESYKFAGQPSYLNPQVQQIAKSAYEDAKGSIEPGGDIIAAARNKLWDQHQAETDPFKKSQITDAYNNIRELSGHAGPPIGRMYEVQLHADPDEFLHWDKPLSEQPASVYQALEPIVSTMKRTRGHATDPSGAEIYNDLARNLGGQRQQQSVAGTYPVPFTNDAAASAALSQAGIPGIRYLDQGSRGPTGKQTHNFVMFDPSLIEIARKYGVPGLIAGGAASAAGSNADAANLIPVDHDPFAGVQ